MIYTRHVHHPDHLDSGIMGWWWKGMCIEGTPESEVHHDLSPLASEKVILKHRYSGFYNTDLETILRCLGIQDLVITGIMTNMCCESTARDAYYRDYRVFFLADGTGSVTEEMHLASLLNLAFGFAYVTTTDRTIDSLQSEAIPADGASGSLSSAGEQIHPVPTDDPRPPGRERGQLGCHGEPRDGPAGHRPSRPRC